VQRGVDARGRARAGDDVAVVDEEDVRVEQRLREPFGQLVGVAPVGRAAAAVEQAGGAEDEGTAADRQDDGAALVGLAQRLEHGRRVVVADGGGRHDHQIGPRGRVQPVFGDQLPTDVETQRLARLLATDEEVEDRDSVVPPVEPEHLADHSELERSGPVDEDHGDALEHGRILPHIVRSATFGRN